MATKKKTQPQLAKVIYAMPVNKDQFVEATDNIEEYGYGDNEVWGEYQLVRKVKVRSEFIMEEI